MKPALGSQIRILPLTLHREYFGQIASGIKKYEFRDLTPYWKARLEGRKYDVIRFRNGYHRDAPEMLVEFLGCEKQGSCYAIKLGKILKIERWPKA